MLNEQDNKIIKWVSLSINIFFLLFLVAGLILSILTITAMNTKDGKEYQGTLLSFGVILALYPMTRMLFKNLSLHLKWKNTTRIFYDAYRVSIKTHLLASLAAIVILLGHAAFWIYHTSQGHYVKMHHGVVQIKPLSFDFGEIVGIVALSMMVIVLISSLIIKYNKDKEWMPTYRAIHITVAITSAILIIIHIATV